MGRAGIYAIGEKWSTGQSEDVQTLPARDFRAESVIIELMFVDRVTIYCQAGDGGSGCLSFRREARVPRGGPSGGDGGKGGDVIVIADENASSLANIVGHKHWRAGRGEHGQGSLMTGKGGEDAVIRVPPGTLVLDADRGFLLRDLGARRRFGRGRPRRQGWIRQQAFRHVDEPGAPPVRARRAGSNAEMSRSN